MKKWCIRISGTQNENNEGQDATGKGGDDGTTIGIPYYEITGRGQRRDLVLSYKK